MPSASLHLTHFHALRAFASCKPYVSSGLTYEPCGPYLRTFKCDKIFYLRQFKDISKRNFKKAVVYNLNKQRY